jgi:hypothetical protein
MRYLFFILMSGCAASVPDYQPERYEPTCARYCLEMNQNCLAVVRPFNRASCNENTSQCFRTCPVK